MGSRVSACGRFLKPGINLLSYLDGKNDQEPWRGKQGDVDEENLLLRNGMARRQEDHGRAEAERWRSPELFFAIPAVSRRSVPDDDLQRPRSRDLGFP